MAMLQISPPLTKYIMSVLNCPAMYSIDPAQCSFYQLLPDCSTLTPGENFTGEVIVEWKIWHARDDSSPATKEVFSYTDGVPNEPNWGQPIRIHDKLKALTLGSASAIQFPLALMFPGTGRLDEQAALVLAVRDIRPRLQWERLILLDEAPRGMGGLFFKVMSDSEWNIPAEDIPRVAKRWAAELEGSRIFWHQYGERYCTKGFGETADILATFLKICTMAPSLCSPLPS